MSERSGGSAPAGRAGAYAICRSDELRDGGSGVRFTLATSAGPQAAFAIRCDGVARAYLNRCAHVPVELDWVEGRFFDDSGLYLICATHGALYEPGSGRCAAGPCRGQGLVSLKCFEEEGRIWIVDGDAGQGDESRR